jgi:hypothetical protein
LAVSRILAQSRKVKIKIKEIKEITEETEITEGTYSVERISCRPAPKVPNTKMRLQSGCTSREETSGAHNSVDGVGDLRGRFRGAGSITIVL